MSDLSDGSGENDIDHCAPPNSNPDKYYNHYANLGRKDGCWYYNGPQDLLPHDKDYCLSSNDSYCGKEPSEKDPGPFDLKDYPKQYKTKQYNIWNNLCKSECPPAQLMEKYVGYYFWHEFNDLKKEQKKQVLSDNDRNCLFFLDRLLLEYNIAATFNHKNNNTELSDLT